MKILFFVENNWAFGKIHNELIKVLHPEIYCDIIDWRTSYSEDFFRFCKEKYDYFLTTTHGANGLIKFYGVDPKQIIAIIHAEYEIESEIFKILSGENRDDPAQWVGSLAGFASVSSSLRDAFRVRLPYARMPRTLPIGCFTRNYKKNKNKKVENILYCGSFKESENEEMADWERRVYKNKRPYLIKSVCDKTGCNFHVVNGLNFLVMEEVYQNYDLLMFSSLSEGLPTVAIEAIASHVPIIGTNTGIMKEIDYAGAGFTAPFDEQAFIDFSVDKINELNSSSSYINAKNKAEILSYKYDWNSIKPIWMGFFKSLETNRN